MVRISRQTLVPGLGFAVVLGLAVVVALGAARRPEAPLRKAVRAYAAALAAGDAPAAALYRADRDPAPEARRAQALSGVYWAVGALAVEAGGDRALVDVRWVGPTGRGQEERQIWAREADDRWFFVALAR